MEKVEFSSTKGFVIEEEIYANKLANTRVLLARDETWGRTVVIKEIGFSDENQKRLILNEIKNLILLEQYTDYMPYIYDVSMSKRKVLIVMRQIKGISLRDYIERERKNRKRDKVWYDDGYEIYLQICKVLAEIHKKQGFVHKDIKPENILINRTRKESYIIDFGISGVGFGKDVGTEKYMSPEQRSGYRENIGQQSDVFSLAIIGIEMFAGECPEYGKDFILNPVKKEWLKMPIIEDVGGQWYPKLGMVLKQAASAIPSGRYSNAGKMYEALRNVRRGNGKNR